jgi:hypothetical protein
MPDFTMLEHLRRPWSFDEPDVREWAALRIESLESKLHKFESALRWIATSKMDSFGPATDMRNAARAALLPAGEEPK